MNIFIERDWVLHGVCAQTDPEALFPRKGGSAKRAKDVCLGCDVREECLDYALLNQERHGIWGGLSERQRRKILRTWAREHGFKVSQQQALPDEVIEAFARAREAA